MTADPEFKKVESLASIMWLYAVNKKSDKEVPQSKSLVPGVEEIRSAVC